MERDRFKLSCGFVKEKRRQNQEAATAEAAAQKVADGEGEQLQEGQVVSL